MLFKHLIYSGSDVEKFQNICSAFKENNIHYTSRMKDINERSSFFGLDKNLMFQTTKRAKMVYNIYVSRNDVDKAKYYMNI